MTNKDTTKKDDKKHYQNIKVTKLPKSKVEIEGEISSEKMDSVWKKAVAKVSENIELPGFRKGKAPENVLIQKVGEMPILEEAGEIALSEVYADILIDHSVDAIGRPQVSITKLAKGNPLGFKIITSIVPTVTLKDYKKEVEKIAKEKDDVNATDEDVNKVIDSIQNNRKQIERQKLEKEAKEKGDSAEIKDEDITVPAFDDDFVKTLGDFKDVADFREKILANIKKEKEREAKDKKRSKIIDVLVEKTEVDMPDILIESEMEKMMAQFSDDLARARITMEDYLKQIGKTIEDIKKEWLPSAEKRVKVQLALNKVAEEEKIKPTEEDIKKEVAHLTSHYKDADPIRARMYIESVLVNEMVLRNLAGESMEDIKTHDHDH